MQAISCRRFITSSKSHFNAHIQIKRRGIINIWRLSKFNSCLLVKHSSSIRAVYSTKAKGHGGGGRRSGRGENWWEWCESIVKSVNRRCLLCVGAVFLWDRDRITNSEMEETYKKHGCGTSTQVAPPTDSHLQSRAAVGTCGESTVLSADELPLNGRKSNSSGLGVKESSVDLSNVHEVNEDRTIAVDHPSSEQESSFFQRVYQYFWSHESQLDKGHKEAGYIEHDNNQERRDSCGNNKDIYEKSEAYCYNEIAGADDDDDNGALINLDNSYLALNREEIEQFALPLIQNINKRDKVIEGEPLKGWDLMIKQNDIQVYTKPYNDSGLLQYKVIGTYSDISARDFLYVQTDNDDRKKWDTYAVKLEAIDRDAYTGSEVIHWILKFPFPMSNREYLFVRRSWISPDNDAIIIISRSVDNHPKAPKSNQYVRVTEYESEMIIKPHNTIDELGLEYELTYFDDPGAYLPSSVVSYVSKSAMPDFLDKIHSAALRRRNDSQKCNVKHVL